MAGLVAAFCLLGQVSTLAHNLLVRHATCAEHGELVHQASEPAPQSDGAMLPAHVALRAADTEPSDGHGHDHCLTTAHGRGHVGLQAVTAWTVVDQAMPDASLDQARPVCSASHALYRLAPKTSPPA